MEKVTHTTGVPQSGGAPRLLDLFCKAGGASMGYWRAGFCVTGVDIEPQKNYPFRFIQADALSLDMDFLRQFDAIHASPPCQHYSWSAARWDKEYPDLVASTREMLVKAGVEYVMENVVGAPLINPITLCGEMFGLGVVRHRLFETSFDLLAPAHIPHRGTVKEGAYVTVAGHGGDGRAAYHLWCEAMGIDWMSKQELTQAIPPAYTEWIGRHLRNILTSAR